MRLPHLLKRHAPPLPFHRRSLSPTSSGSPPPPAYDVVIHRESEQTDAADADADAVSVHERRAAMDPLGAAERPISTINEKDQTSVMVMFREDYVYARAYIREMDYKKAMRRAMRRHYYKWYALAIVIITITALMSAKHDTIVEFCQPVTHRIREWPAGWLVPIAFLIVVSFPPLFGHELIGILCGLVWGLGEGFAILCAGTFLGEMATWIAFKWFCTARAAKFERRNKLYATLTQLIREKSFLFVLVLRFSAVPGHITTAVSASAGANVWSYMAAAILTLPKQLVIAYLGTAFGQHSFKNTIISWAATILTFIGTVIAAIYIYYQMRIMIKRGSVVLPPLSGEGGPTWADLEVAEDRRVSMVEVRGEKGRRSIDVFLGPQPRRGRMPGLSPGLEDGYPIRTPGRTRSLPGPIGENEMRDWLAQIDTALLTGGGAVQNGFSEEGAAVPDRRALTETTPAPGIPLIAIHDSPSTTPVGLPGAEPAPEIEYPPLRAPHRRVDSAASRASSRSRVDSLRDRDGGRGTVSLDIERRTGGRDVADDADRYAYLRGGRRADYARMRGDSRAALLGRPEDDDLR
ncbi:hypothetical protein Q5752_006257 [Cryptotrichosporon argae]